MPTIAIFASGTGSNAAEIINYFRRHPAIRVGLVACNKPDAGVLRIAASENIPDVILNTEKFFMGNAYVDELQGWHIDFIVLAGFLWKVPAAVIRAFPSRIVNIHPALLPKFGGKKMYGKAVHEAVINAGETESGITIHYVDEWYDHGAIIFQARCSIEAGETPVSLARKVQALEHHHYPREVEKLLINRQAGAQ